MKNKILLFLLILTIGSSAFASEMCSYLFSGLTTKLNHISKSIHKNPPDEPLSAYQYLTVKSILQQMHMSFFNPNQAARYFEEKHSNEMLDEGIIVRYLKITLKVKRGLDPATEEQLIIYDKEATGSHLILTRAIEIFSPERLLIYNEKNNTEKFDTGFFRIRRDSMGRLQTLSESHITNHNHHHKKSVNGSDFIGHEGSHWITLPE